MKKLLCGILSLTLLLSGCTRGNQGGSQPTGGKTVPMGRYVEEEGEIIEGVDRVNDLRSDGNGNVIFYGTATDDDGQSTIRRYSFPQSGGSLTAAEQPWLDQIYADGYFPNSLSEGKDGLVYALCSTMNSPSDVLMRTTDGQTYEQVSVSDWSKPSAPEGGGDLTAADTVSFSSGVSGGIQMDVPSRYAGAVYALEDGGFLIAYGDQGASRYSADGSVVAEFPGFSMRYSTAIYGGQLLLQSPDSKELWLYDMDEGKKVGAYTYDNLTYSTRAGLDAEGLFLADATGVHRQAVGGSLWERLVDGDLTSMVMPNQSMQGLTADGSGGFWAVTGSDNECRLTRFAYSADTPTNPDTELTIFSLQDNATVRQTMGEFQRRNPNVRVNFQVALGNEETAATAEDVIRTLNTELLSGKAPDLLLLDGLPVESYIQKGVLTDLTDFVGELTNAQGLLANLMNAYQREGKIYGVPARFSFPVMLGETAAVDGVGSLGDLVVQVKSSQGQTPPFLLPPVKIWDDLGMLLDYYKANVNTFVSGREVDQAALTTYLSDMLEINNTVREHAPQAGGMMGMAAMTIASGSSSGFEEMDMGAMSLGKGEARFHVQHLSGLINLFTTSRQLGEKDGYKLDTLFGGTVYTPVGGIGITAAGKQQDLAKSFVELMLSDTVQGKYLYDGFSVNGKSLDKLVAEELKDQNDMGFPALCRTLNTPVLVDQVIYQAVEEEVKGLLDGSVTPAQAADNIIKNTELYRAE